MAPDPRPSTADSFARGYWRAAHAVGGELPELSPDTLDDATFRLLADNLPTLCWVANGDGSIVWYNRRWHDYCGTIPQEMEGWGWTKVHDPELLPTVLERWRAAIAAGEPFEMVFPLRGADGVFRPFLTRIAPVRDGTGAVKRWCGVNTKISHQVAAEAALRESEEFNRRVLAASDDCIKVLDLDGRLEFMSEGGMCAMEVEDFGAVRGACWPDFWQGEDHDGAMAAIAEAKKGGTGRFQGFATTMKGSPRWWDVVVSPISGPDGRPERLLAVSRDISEQKRAEVQLRDSEGRLSFLSELDEALRVSGDAPAAMHAAATLLAQRLGASRCAYADVDGDNNTFTIHRDYTAPGVASSAGLYSLDLFGPRAAADMRAGRTLVVRDVAGELAPGEGREVFLSIGVSAIVCCPLVKEGRLVAMMAVHQDRPRPWRADEVALVETVVERCWAHVERAGAEARLRETAERYRLAARATNDAIWDWRMADGHVVWNEALTALFGHGVAETTAEWWIEHIHPDDRARVDRSIHAVIDGGGTAWTDEYRFLRADGSFADILDRGTVLRDETGRAVRMIGAMLDLSERKRAEAELMRVNTLLSAVMEAVPGVVYAKDREGRMLAANRGTAELIGKPPAEFIGRTDLEFLDDEAQAEAVRANDRRVMERGAVEVLEEAVSAPDGTPLVWLSTKAPFRDAAGRVVGLVGASVDITERKRAERALVDLNATLESRVAERTAERDRMWTLAEDMLARANYSGMMTAVNPAWTKVLGFTEEELLSRPYSDFMHPDDVGVTLAALQSMGETRRATRFENRILTAAGDWKPIGWTVAPEPDDVNFIAVGRDLSEDKRRAAELERAQDALRQAQKMEAVGQLTGGIAHDFNNMLAVVIGSLDLLGRRLAVGGDPRAKRYLDAASDGAKRAATLTQRLLAFSRQQPLRPEPVEVNKLVVGMSDLLRHSLGGAVRLETVLAGGLWRTHADPNQLESVILNLAVNARDAMPDGGRLTIETQNAHLDERYVAAHLGVSAGQYVLIAVTDTGAGMPPDVVAKAFDPFFTTKAVGKGTGLGLSQVYGFVKQSGGHVKIYSEPEQGTTVKVYLPRLIGAGGETAAEADGADLPLGEREEVVLVVEDEPAVRRFSVDALTELGYRVLEADGAAAALRFIDAHPEIALMFTDVVMPDVNGRKLADEALKRRPDLKVLFTTGYTRNAVVHNGVLDPGVELIGKPFTIEQLAAKLREVLDAPAGARSGGEKR